MKIELLVVSGKHHLTIITMLGILLLVPSCKESYRIGEVFYVPSTNDCVTFAIEDITSRTLTNKWGNPIPGIVLHGCSFVGVEGAIQRRNITNYAVFHDMFLGIGVKQECYWQVSKKRVGVGLTVFDTHRSIVDVVTIKTNGMIHGVQRFKVAHVALSIESNLDPIISGSR